MKRLFTILISIFLYNLSLFSQVTYTNLEPDFFMSFSNSPGDKIYNLDINNDSDFDLYFKFVNESYLGTYYITIGNINDIEFYSDAYNYNPYLNYNDTISNFLNWQTSINPGINEFPNKFIGFRKKVGNDYYYGWIRLKGKYIVPDFCISTIPNNFILAGEGMPLIAEAINVEDNSNYKDGRDLYIEFERPVTELGINSYRIFLVKSDSADSFTLNYANSLPDSLSKEILTDTLDYSLFLDSTSYDVDGDLITEFVPYKIFILSVVDGVNLTENLLSVPSDEIILTSPCEAAQDLNVSQTYMGNTKYIINYSFSKASNESGIAEYRAFFIKQDSINYFSLEDANLLNEDRYITKIPNGSVYTGLVDSDTLLDCYGNLIEHEQNYILRVLSVADGTINNINTLSDTSNIFNLKTELPITLYIKSVEDISNTGNALDFKIDYISTSASNIIEFRVYCKKLEDTIVFNRELALQLPEEAYYTTAPTIGESTLYLPETFLDIDGDEIQQNIPYVFYMMAVADSIEKDISLLTKKSNIISLSYPAYFKAGQTIGDNVYYTELDTPIVVEDGYSDNNDAYIDINNDGTDDYKIQCYSFAKGSAGATGLISSLDSNKIATLVLSKSNWRDFTDTLNLGFMINKDLTWSDEGYLYDYGYYPLGSWSYKLWCGFDAYAGLKIIDEEDTLYAWISLSVECGSCTIYSYAYQSNVDNVNDQINNYNISVYPNPAKSVLNIEINDVIINNKSSIKIYNIAGVTTKNFTMFGNKTSISVNDLSPGVYFIEIRNKEFTYYQKIVISD